jgi:uncharacterized protein (DUF1810 family)
VKAERSGDLGRFVDAQAPVYESVRAELRRGRKTSHWMWFVFPQLAGLGRSAMAQHYALASLDEARAYLRHPVLGPRLLECTRLVNAIAERSIGEIFGDPDDLKFRSAMTLFARADPAEAAFGEALARFFGGAPDPRTLELLDREGAPPKP